MRRLSTKTEFWALTQRLQRSFLAACIRRFIKIEGFDRGIVVASQAFTALIPIVILSSTLAPAGAEDLLSQGLINKFHLDGDTAEAVEQLFDIPDGPANSLSVASVLLLVYSGIAFTRRLQRMYQAAWGRSKSGVRGGIFAALGLVLLLVEIAVLYGIRSIVRNLPLDWLIMIPLSALAGVVLWTSIPWLLLNREVHWRRLVGPGVVAATATSLYSVATAVYMPGLMEQYTNEFGLFGITMGMISWLLCITLVVVATAAIGAEFDQSQEPWARYLKSRFRLYDPATAPDPAETQALLAEAEQDFRNPFILARIGTNILVVALAVWVAAEVVPGVEVEGGATTLLLVSLTIGLVNAVLGPVLYLVAFPITVLSLGLFAAVVNGALLMVTAALSPDFAVGGLLGAVLAAFVVSSVTTAIGLLLDPVKHDLGGGLGPTG